MPSSSRNPRQPKRLHKKSTYRSTNHCADMNPDVDLDIPPPAYRPNWPGAEAADDAAADNISLPSYHTHGQADNASTRSLFEYRPAPEVDVKQPPADEGQAEAQQARQRRACFRKPTGPELQAKLKPWPVLLGAAVFAAFWIVIIVKSFQGQGNAQDGEERV